MKKKPNILILFSDQHNAGVLGSAGHPDIATPYLDQLASEGVQFDRAYCQNGICMASRSSMFSGLYPRSLGCFAWERTEVMRQATSMQKTFQQQGYQTVSFGKRHLHLGCDEGWDIQKGYFPDESVGESYWDWLGERGLQDVFARDWAAEFGMDPEEKQEIPFALMSARASDLPEDATMEAWTKQKTVDLLKSRKKDDAPFFCFSSFYRPHQPYTPLPRYFNRFDRSAWGKGLTEPASLHQSPSELPPLFQEQHAGKNRIWRFDLAREDEQIYRDGLAAYYALVEEIDTHVGEILQALEETGERENTIVIYATDHGDFAGAHGMLEKAAPGHNIFEDTLRIPLLISWPEHIEAERRNDGLVELVDLFPTLMDLCDMPISEQLEGESIAPYLLRNASVGKPWIVSENWSQSTVITPRYKWGQWLDTSETIQERDYRDFGDMLFDRVTDPLELQNHLQDLPEIQQELSQYLDEWQERFGPIKI
ncbi:sulfatase-like hydrolase/transferase [Kiritimatiellota bacterium B12222]|nr:sulfatase-like hydrolase/transferase [Kiritimatiellota bacterium B12222]